MIDDSRSSESDLQATLSRVLAPIETAREAVIDERSETVDEIDAFNSFKQAVTSVQPSGPAPVGSAKALSVAERDCLGVQQIRDAYRETVMAVKHYDAIYGEELQDSLAREFGDGIAERLRCRSGSLTPIDRQAVLTAADNAATARSGYVDQLDREREWLDRTETTFSNWIVSFSETDLSDSDDIRQLATERQQFLHSRPDISGESGHRFCVFVYRDQAWTYPVLTAVTRLLSHLDC